MSGRRNLSAPLIRLEADGTLPGNLKCSILFVQLTILTFTFAVAGRVSGREEHSFREAEPLIQVQVFYDVFLLI